MKYLKKLPNGYKSRVTECKKHCERIVNSFKNSGMQLEQNINWLKSVISIENVPVYQNISVYEHEGEFHLSFDYDVISTEIIYQPKTDRYRLFESCTVFPKGRDSIVDNYRW